VSPLSRSATAPPEGEHLLAGAPRKSSPFGGGGPAGRRGLRGGLLLLTALACLAGAAADPAERLTDPVQEARAREIFREVRCLVCQNESIDDSEADLAGDLRQVVRDQVKQGRSDTQIRAFLVERYGEFVLLKPPFSLGNALLWATPVIALILGGVAMTLLLRRRTASAPGDEDTQSLSQVEEARLQVLLKDE